MALTIQNSPGSYFSAHGDVIFTVYEATKANDPVTYPDYRYICDVYVGTEMVARLKALPRPDNKMGVFNVGNIIRSYIAAQLKPTLNGTSINSLLSWEAGLGDWRIGATMKFGEEYDFTTYTNVTVDTERFYYNHYNGRLIGVNTNLESYLSMPLTRRPTTGKMYRNTNYWFIGQLPISTEFGFYKWHVKLYNRNMVEVAHYLDNFIPAAENNQMVFNVSPAAINGYLQATLANPGLIAVTDYIYFIEFYITLDAVGGESLHYLFELVCEPRFEVYTLHFLNSLGAFESVSMTKVSRKAVMIEKTEYGRLPYQIDMSGMVSYFNSNKVYNETRSVYASQYTEKLTLNSDLLTDGEYQWLADLVISPMVFIELNGYFIPCVITGNNYDFRKVINDKLTNLTINIEFGGQFNAQFR